MKIPFYYPFHGAKENEYINECLQSSLATGGAFSNRAFLLLKRLLGQENLLFVPTCSSALELSLALLPLKPGDEILLPSFNFPSAANAALQKGLIPIFCDINPRTQNICLSEIEKRITAKTKALITVDYAGIACDYDSIRDFARERSLFLIEDAAQSLGSYYKKEPLGIQGDFSGISFHNSKNIACGEGGLFFCKNKDFYALAQIYQMHGTNRQDFFKGLCDYYTWQLPGSSLPLNELSCALLLSQLEEISTITAYRRERLFAYLNLLKPLEEKGLAAQMQIPDYCTPNGHLYYLRFSSHSLMEKAKNLLYSKGIDARTHYVPLHASPMGRRLGYEPKNLPESLKAYETLLRLPLHTGLTKEEQEKICEILLNWGRRL